MIYDRAHETMPRDELTQLQTERLQTTLHRVYRNVAFYRALFDERKIDVDGVKDLRALADLPFTTREDLRSSYPYGMFAVPMRDIVRIHATSGTTGQPIAVGYTKNDIAHWTDLVARQLAAVGITEHDVVQVAFSYSLFTGGLGFHYGAEKIGAAVIPASSGRNLREQITIMKDYKATALVTLPSYAAAIATTLEEMKIHPGELFLKCGLFGAEPWPEALRVSLEQRLHLTAYDTYGLSEVMGPGVAAECPERCGMHVNEDHFIVEVIDPTTLEPLSPGREGELVFTTITKGGFPLIRYRTRDLARIVEGPCACGRTGVRISRIAGRSDDMIIIRGIKIFPSQIEHVLRGIEGLRDEYRVVVDKKDGADRLEIQVAVSDTNPAFDEVKGLELLRATIARKTSDALGVDPRVSFVEAASLEQEPGKKRRRV